MNKRAIEFSILKDSYLTVKDFLEKESGMKIKSLSTNIERDLYLSGDDNHELLEKFIMKFNLNYEGFDYSKHFLSEGELFGSGEVLIKILKTIIWFPLKAIELASINRLKLLSDNFFDPPRQTQDLSFRDILTWFIEGKYKLGSEVKYELK